MSRRQSDPGKLTLFDARGMAIGGIFAVLGEGVAEAGRLARPALSALPFSPCGGVAEWSKAAVLKTVDPSGSVGSNPTPSAIVSIDRSAV